MAASWFDGDREDTFTTLVQWIESNRMECATFHILTPYPGTPLFRQLDAEKRLLHRDWEKYDTAHVVFQPKQMTPEELLLGYDWLYRRLFSHASIWRRKPHELSAMPTYFAGCYLYKRSNRLWRFLAAPGGNDAGAAFGVSQPVGSTDGNKKISRAYRDAIPGQRIKPNQTNFSRRWCFICAR